MKRRLKTYFWVKLTFSEIRLSLAYTNLASPTDSVIILVADGARPDTLAEAIDRGKLPALGRLHREGGMYTVTTVFPSVTGPAYTPFVVGKYPGSVGLPGIRWYDRSHQTCSWPGYARSYVGFEMCHVDTDLTSDTPTMFERVPNSIGALSVIQRGLMPHRKISHGLWFAARTAMTHFRGNVRGWLDIDRDIGRRVTDAVDRYRPQFVFAAFTGTDKTSHAEGPHAPIVLEALQIVDRVAAQIRENAERGGYWDTTHLWIVSDHGHSQVTEHEDLARILKRAGMNVLAHPNIFTPNADIAVMVSGNAMAHLYVGLQDRTRKFWPALRNRALRNRWEALVSMLLARESVDLLVLPSGPRRCEILTKTRGSATLEWTTSSYDYHPNHNGDPLRIGPQQSIDANTAYNVTKDSDYPDALVQLAALCEAPRSGDIILSAARGWDFRARYEPIPHVSAHGALHRDHILVPMIMNRPPRIPPRRTVDTMVSALEIFGLGSEGLDGTSFV